MATRPKKPVLVADLVSRFLSKRHGHPDRTSEAAALKVFNAFMKIGPPVTDHVEPAFFKHGMLTLTVQESTWLTELTFLKPQILERVNLALGKEVVSDLRMRQGKLMRKPPPAPPRVPPLTHAQAERVAAWASLIPNDTVREAMMRAATRSLATPKRSRPLTQGPPGPRPAPPRPVADLPEPPKDRWAGDRDRWKDKDRKKR